MGGFKVEDVKKGRCSRLVIHATMQASRIDRVRVGRRLYVYFLPKHRRVQHFPNEDITRFLKAKNCMEKEGLEEHNDRESKST